MNLCGGAILVALLALAPPAAAQSQDGGAAQVDRIVPVPARSNPSAARVARLGPLDIPQEAKDAGHNGAATWTATVGADGKLVDLTLKRSSNSPAIDAAARAMAESAHYFPATDREGHKVEGSVDVRLEYARWNKESPGGGLDTYRCGDLVRETDWFADANAGTIKIFALENFFVSQPSLMAMQEGAIWSRTEREQSRAKRGKEWVGLIRQCRKTPDRAFLDLVDNRAFYRRLVESF